MSALRSFGYVLIRTQRACILDACALNAFDILKPWPIDWADKRVAGALGIMLDDIFAAIYAIFLLLVLKLLWSHIT